MIVADDAFRRVVVNRAAWDELRPILADFGMQLSDPQRVLQADALRDEFAACAKSLDKARTTLGEAVRSEDRNRLLESLRVAKQSIARGLDVSELQVRSAARDLRLDEILAAIGQIQETIAAVQDRRRPGDVVAQIADAVGSFERLTRELKERVDQHRLCNDLAFSLRNICDQLGATEIAASAKSRWRDDDLDSLKTFPCREMPSGDHGLERLIAETTRLIGTADDRCVSYHVRMIRRGIILCLRDVDAELLSLCGRLTSLWNLLQQLQRGDHVQRL